MGISLIRTNVLCLGVITLDNHSLLPNRIILCVDLRNFYASVSCIKKGLDPRYTKLAVVGDVNRSGSFVRNIEASRYYYCESNYAYVYEVFNLHNRFSFTIC